MDEAYIEQSSKRDALDILEQLGGWPVILGDKWTDNNFTWYRLTEKASILGFSSSRILTEGITFTFACNNWSSAKSPPHGVWSRFGIGT
jgi:hypothetical protein